MIIKMNQKFLKYIIPSVIASILSGIYVIVDGFFIGQVLGDNGLAAINISWPITSFIQTFGLAIGISSGIYITSLKAKGKIKEEENVLGMTLVIFVVLSIFLSLLCFFLLPILLPLLGADNITYNYAYDYIKIILLGSIFQIFGLGLIPLLRNIGYVKIACFAMITSSLINFIGDYLFIYVFDMGLQGVAFASVLGQAASMLIGLCVLLKHSKRRYHFNLQIILNLFKMSLAPYILNFSYAILLIITNLVCKKYGGNEAIACYTLLSYILYIINMTASGCGDGIQPLISNYHALQMTKEKKSILVKTLSFSFILISLMVIVMYLYHPALADLYNLSDLATMFYETGIIFYLIGFLLVSIIRVGCCYLYACQDVKKANLLVIIDPLFLAPLSLFILSYYLHVQGIWLSFLCTQIILLLLTLLLIYLSFKEEKYV